MKASVFREFEVAVRPEPPPTPVAPDGRTAEDTLVGKMGLGDGGAPGWAGSVSVGVFAAMTEKLGASVCSWGHYGMPTRNPSGCKKIFQGCCAIKYQIAK